MNFTVTWKPAAENELAELWTTGPDRAAIGAAADQIDVQLRRDPLAVGESRAEPMRILIEPPLAVNYQVNELDRTVWVSDVWRWGATP